MLTGEYNHNMDAKGRVTVPAKFREVLGASFIVTRGFEGCLTAYSMERFDGIRKHLEQISLTNAAGRKLSRLLLGNAIECEPDQMGRILISAPLRNAADLKKDVVLCGLGDRVEIWDQEAWNAMNSRDALDDMTPEELEKLEQLEL